MPVFSTGVALLCDTRTCCRDKVPGSVGTRFGCDPSFYEIVNCRWSLAIKRGPSCNLVGWYLGILLNSGLPLTGDDDDDNDSDGRTVLALKRSCVPPTSSSVHVQTGYQG